MNGDSIAINAAAPALTNALGARDEVIVGFRAVKSVNRAELPEKTATEKHGARIDANRVLLHRDGSTRDLPVIKIEDQTPGASGVGPAVIEEDFWTCKVDSGWSFEFTANGDVLFKKIK